MGTISKCAYPSIVIKIQGGLYSVNSKYISTILQLPGYETLPDAPPFITGIFYYRNEIVEMLDLRRVFGMPTLNQEYGGFADMLDARKQDHIHWVMELERTLESGEKFTMATDPHQCAFGKWYDSFHCDNNALAYHLKKIDEPHKRLHQAADETVKCKKQCDECIRDECLKAVLKRTKEQYMPLIVGLLDEAKSIFKSTVYHEMILVLSGGLRLGIVVDEVLSVEDLSKTREQEALHRFHSSPYITGIEESRNMPGLILELDVPKIMELASASH